MAHHRPLQGAVGPLVKRGSRIARIGRVTILSFAALLAALGIPIIVRSSHRLGQRGEVTLDADEPDGDRSSTPDP